MKDSLHYLTMLCGDLFSDACLSQSRVAQSRDECRPGHFPTRSTLCSQQFIDVENAKRCNDVQADDYADSIADCTRSQNSLHTYSMYMESSRFRPQVHALGGHGSQVVYPMALSSPQPFFTCLLYDHDGDIIHGVSR